MIGSTVAKPITMPRTSVLEQSGFVRNDDATTLAGLSFSRVGLNIVELFWDQVHLCHPSPGRHRLENNISITAGERR